MNAFWEIVASNAVVVVLLAAAVAVVGRFWKNPHGLYVLWLLVLLKFVTPPLFTVGFHLPGKPMSAVHDDPITVSAGEEARTAELDRSPLPASSEQAIAPDPSVDVPQVTKQREIPWLIVLAELWTIGFGGIAVWQAFRILRFGRLLRAAQPAPPDVLRMAAETGKQLGLRRAPAIRMLPVRVSPMIWIIGLKPQVLLPTELFKRLEPAAQSLLLAHELAHVRRKDHLVRLLQLLISTLFWWHPVVWWACRELQQLEELCCDAMVAGLVPSSKKAYATALMDTLDFLCDGFIAPPLGATAAKSSALLARRIAMMKIGAGVVRFTFGRLVLLVLVAAIPMSLAFAAKPPKGDGSNSSAGAIATTPEPSPEQYARRSDESTPITRSGESLSDEQTAVSNIRRAGGQVEWSSELGYTVTFSNITDAGLEHLKGLTELRGLSLMRTRVTDAGLEHLKGLTKLQRLSLMRTRVTDTGLEHLKGLTKLQSLSLRGTQITDAGLKHLTALSGLQELILGGGIAISRTQITDAGLEHLKALSGLQTLGLQGTQVTGAGLEHLKGLTKLQTLFLDNTRVTDAGLEHLKALRGLRCLTLPNQITDAGLEKLKKSSGLNTLYLDHTQITDAGLEHLKGLGGHKELHISYTRVTDAGLEKLKGLSGLNTFYLDHTQVTDAGLAYLAGLTSLRVLMLDGTNVTDAGLAHLARLTQVQALRLRFTGVTAEGVAKLRKALPNCRVVWP